MTIGACLACLSLSIWLYLLVGRGMFWLTRERGDEPGNNVTPLRWPSVVAVVPARNEADVIERSIGSLIGQDYPGTFSIILVDDQSDDGTAARSRVLGENRLRVISGSDRPAGWTGKLWAVSQGIAEARAKIAPDYLWLTDADIAHTPDNLRTLVLQAERSRLVLVSQMAKLSCITAAERFLIPAFVYFFDMLYPFAWVNAPRSSVAAAAGGCMLVRREALEAAGGIAAIRNAIIDDCALGRLMKAQGPIRLDLTERALSIRPYTDITMIRRMIARSAYAQLGYSSLLLAGTLAALTLIFVAPPLFALFGNPVARIAGLAAWLIMAATFIPMLRFYGRSVLWGLALPVIGTVYAAFTLDSAIQHWQGRGGMWKGRAQAIAQR